MSNPNQANKWARLPHTGDCPYKLLWKLLCIYEVVAHSSIPPLQNSGCFIKVYHEKKVVRWSVISEYAGL